MIFAEVLLVNSYIYGIAVFFMHDSFNFLESSAVTDISFLIIITAGDIKQLSVVKFAFSSGLPPVSLFVVSAGRLFFSIGCPWLNLLLCGYFEKIFVIFKNFLTSFVDFFVSDDVCFSVPL